MSKGKIIGYIRVSSITQNDDRQLEGIELDKTFVDKASGKDTNRPALKDLMDYVRDGDTVIIHSMDRLARNLDDLRKLVKYFTEKDVKVKFVKENITFSGDDNSMSVLLLSIMGAFAEFERSLIRERQAEGIAIAKAKGVYKGRKRALPNEQIQELKNRVNNRENKAQIARDFNISRTTLYRIIEKY